MCVSYCLFTVEWMIQCGVREVAERSLLTLPVSERTVVAGTASCSSVCSRWWLMRLAVRLSLRQSKGVNHRISTLLKSYISLLHLFSSCLWLAHLSGTLLVPPFFFFFFFNSIQSMFGTCHLVIWVEYRGASCGCGNESVSTLSHWMKHPTGEEEEQRRPEKWGAAGPKSCLLWQSLRLWTSHPHATCK